LALRREAALAFLGKIVMNIIKINVDQWYQTKSGVGKCLTNSGPNLKFEIDGEEVYLPPRDVQHEIAKGQEPQQGRCRPSPSADSDEQPVFANCNACGITLRSKDEFAMGMCERCAAEPGDRGVGRLSLETGRGGFLRENYGRVFPATCRQR
jgi:hypothetical protein